MKIEIFDVVDQSDRVIGQAPRAHIHANGLKHRAVHILVFNSRGEVFLQKRSMLKDSCPGTWDSSASGHLDAGEEYDAAAVREMFEELGLTPSAPLERLFKISACAETGQEHVWVYSCHAEGPFTLHPMEIETGGWFAPADVTAWLAARPEDFASAVRVIWPAYLEKGTSTPGPKI